MSECMSWSFFIFSSSTFYVMYISKRIRTNKESMWTIHIIRCWSSAREAKAAQKKKCRNKNRANLNGYQWRNALVSELNFYAIVNWYTSELLLSFYDQLFSLLLAKKIKKICTKNFYESFLLCFASILSKAIYFVAADFGEVGFYLPCKFLLHCLIGVVKNCWSRDRNRQESISLCMFL